MPTKIVASVSDLLDDRTHHIEFNGHLTNHVKHAVVALAGIGAPEQMIRDYYKSYTQLTPYGFPVEPQRASSAVIDSDNWREFLGRRVHFSAYCRFFDEVVAREGSTGAVVAYGPELLRGWIGAFTHATIHLGWALWADHPGMVAEALAYLAFSYVRVVADERPHIPESDPVESALRLAADYADEGDFHAAVTAVITDTNAVTDLHPELNRSGLQARVAGVAQSAIPALTDAPTWVTALPPTERRERVRRAVTLLYLASPGDFVVLHLLTSLFALEVVADTIDDPAATDTVYDLFWAGARIILAAERKIPTEAKLRELDALYSGPAGDHSAYATDEFDVIARRAWLEDEEHNPKLVFVLRSWWNATGWSAYRHTAAQFTSTPDLPPSFAEPPTE